MTYIATEATTGTPFASVTLSGGTKLPQSLPSTSDGAPVSTANPMPVAVQGTVTVTNPTPSGLTDTQLRATPLPVSGTVAVSNPTAVGLTDTQLRATPVPVSGTVAVGGTVTVSNPTAAGLTDTQLRATPLPVSGTVTVGSTPGLTDTQLRATPLPVSGSVTVSSTPGVTDTQLRATPLPVSGSVTVTSTTGLTDTQLRASAVPMSLATLPALTTGAAVIGSVAQSGSWTVGITSPSAITLIPASTTGGVSSYHKLIAAATTNATSVKTTSGSIGFLDLFNTSASTKFVKLYSKASAPVVGTDVPALTLAIPAGGRASWNQAVPLRFGSGIAYSITGLVADLDTTAVAAGDVIVGMGYV